MLTEILKHIATESGMNAVNAQPLSGGDINEVYLLQGEDSQLVVKCNSASKFPGMFEAEAKGLKLLKSSNSFHIPSVISKGTVEDAAYLTLTYIEEGVKGDSFWSQFAENLVNLHKTTQAHFGLDHDNYIGSLKQYNCPERTAADFYLNQRMIPQFRMVINNGFSFSGLKQFYKNVEKLIPDENPALVHGDLWGGNYMVNQKGEPVLIDPAVAFAPREMDLAMMQLFGGFSSEVFEMYHEQWPLENDWKARIPLYQLYYLLVHLNIFGQGYYDRVNSIVQRFV
ncbi:fructosamine kinase family protein [Luteirhabdus pelagi]|uniref:fructosamine kinase family protein n=1 Tax=Luteirhabdus pelagi TaxID=2792783 RepID=UPI00193A1701|nr:fructosamine kinase family protein [Luteirhabdus pelagi]